MLKIHLPTKTHLQGKDHCVQCPLSWDSDHSVFQLNDSLDSIPLTESPHGEDALITKRKATAGSGVCLAGDDLGLIQGIPYVPGTLPGMITEYKP